METSVFCIASVHLCVPLLSCFHMPTDLEQSIGRTLCWFSVMKYPVTGFEIWKWLIEPARPYDLSEVYRVLVMSEWVRTHVQEKNGRYVLKGDEYHHIRSERYIDATKKFRRLRRALSYISLFKSVRAVGAVNSVAWWSTTEKSDIDLFIVTKPNAIWSTRFWIVLPFLLFGVRPGASEENPFCFSFFATQHALALDHLRLKDGDHYFAFWLKSIVPVLDRAQCFERMSEQNRWSDAFLPNVSNRVLHPHHRHQSLVVSFPHVGFFEAIYKKIQQKRFPATIKQLMNTDSRVVVNDHVLKFHETDRRAEFERAYEHRLKNLFL